MLGKCTEPEVTPPTIPNQHYVINPTSVFTLDVTYDAFTWTDYSDWQTIYALSMSMTETTLGAVPTWATLVSASNKVEISTYDNADSGVYTLTIVGDLVEGSTATTFTGSVSFDVYLIEIVSTVPASMTISIGKGDESQTITPWSFTPIDPASNIGSYTFQYSVVVRKSRSVKS